MIAMLIILANLADLLTFLCAASVLGLGGEANPIARLVYAHAGLLGIIGLKTGGIALVLALLHVLSAPAPSWAIGLFVALPLFGAVMNTAAIVVTR